MQRCVVSLLSWLLPFWPLLSLSFQKTIYDIATWKLWRIVSLTTPQLLLSDSYLPGALVLAHSLRDAGTSKRLAVLVTLDSVSAEAITQLKVRLSHV